ncbi:MAG: hypothetical protein Kow00127_08380 [Bacteroidales bacterium]
MVHKIYTGSGVKQIREGKPSGGFTTIDGESFYEITGYDLMPDFFISIVSDSDHWMFISSNGALTAGRTDRDHALFPYYTEDKIHDYRGKTGSTTTLLVEKEGKIFLWDPFSTSSEENYRIERRLAKSIYGNKILFTETNHDLGIRFRYGWHNSDRYGFVRKAYLENTGPEPVRVTLLDGIRNILPAGIDYTFQNEYSNLADAYKRNEHVEDTLLALFTLSSVPVDRAEPSESLRCTTVWSAGLDEETTLLLSDRQEEIFRSGKMPEPEEDIRAARGAYLLCSSFTLKPGSPRNWMIVAEIDQDSAEVANLIHEIKTGNLLKEVEQDIATGTEQLKRLVSGADGIQTTGFLPATTRHYMNTLFNIMRGGTFPSNYMIDINDFRNYVSLTNRETAAEFKKLLSDLPGRLNRDELMNIVSGTGDRNLQRITHEYLPLVFSRRHGDPSRPWNRFSIITRDDKGNIRYHYEGNWRDIFQNWEALAWSFPCFIDSFIARFVNASTIDGFNPYRISRQGIDWEVPNPDDPWAYIGYWGDHQIIYLQKLLELVRKFYPGKLTHMLSQDQFVYANVPYRLKDFNRMVENPRETVLFDFDLHRRIKEEWANLGADAALLKGTDGKQIYHVTLAEKILVTTLARLAHFIPEAGIWMNTQRPEWNDANNALVGNGASMVTLNYLHRFASFWRDVFSHDEADNYPVSEEVVSLFGQMKSGMETYRKVLAGRFSPGERKAFADSMGTAHSDYREGIYKHSFSGLRKNLKSEEIAQFFELLLEFTGHSIRHSKRDDGLYHSYNLITIASDGITIRPLYEMLEGQVAVLSSGALSPAESLQLMDALKKSKMFRHDQYSYMLYPDRQLPRFTEKNNIPEEEVGKSVLLQKMIEKGDTSIIVRDVAGGYHFNAKFRNADLLKEALDRITDPELIAPARREQHQILGLYEKLFDHHSFTGRSGTFYAYEGLGSIYWHMVSKLLLAVQETFTRPETQNDPFISGKLKEHYYEIRAGIGLNKEPHVYGAFPVDAYSHTPGHSGARQPGLTGQVKEDVISRIREMGIRVNDGALSFDPVLLHPDEWLTSATVFGFFNQQDKYSEIPLKQGQLALTFCQTPVIFTRSEKNQIRVLIDDGEMTITGLTLPVEISQQIFNRTGKVQRLEVQINENGVK